MEHPQHFISQLQESSQGRKLWEFQESWAGVVADSEWSGNCDERRTWQSNSWRAGNKPGWDREEPSWQNIHQRNQPVSGWIRKDQESKDLGQGHLLMARSSDEGCLGNTQPLVALG